MDKELGRVPSPTFPHLWILSLGQALLQDWVPVGQSRARKSSRLYTESCCVLRGMWSLSYFSAVHKQNFTYIHIPHRSAYRPGVPSTIGNNFRLAYLNPFIDPSLESISRSHKDAMVKMMAEICLTHWNHPTLMIIGINVLIFSQRFSNLLKNRFIFGNVCFLFMKFLT